MPPPAWIWCRQKGSQSSSPSFFCQIVFFPPSWYLNFLSVGWVRERGPRHRAHFEKSIWSLSLTGIQVHNEGQVLLPLEVPLSLWLISYSPSFSKDPWTSIPDGSSSGLGNPATPSASLPCEYSSPMGDPYLLWRILASFCPSNQMRLQPSLCRCMSYHIKLYRYTAESCPGPRWDWDMGQGSSTLTLSQVWGW